MAAIPLRIALCVELSVYLVLFGTLAWSRSLPLWAVLLLVFLAPLALRVVVVLGTFAFAALAQPSGASLGIAGWIGMIAREVGGLLRFEHLIRWHPKASAPHATRADAPLVVLLHGIYCSGAVWRPIVAELEARTGCTVWSPDIVPSRADLATQSECFADRLAQAAALHGSQDIIVIAHSLGGLIARLYLTRTLGAVPIRKLICLATPHQGSLMARMLFSPIGRDLRPGSTVLTELASAPSAGTTEIVSYQLERDNLVVPASSACLPGARNIALTGIGHISMIYSRAVVELLVREVLANRSTDAVRAA